MFSMNENTNYVAIEVAGLFNIFFNILIFFFLYNFFTILKNI